MFNQVEKLAWVLGDLVRLLDGDRNEVVPVGVHAGKAYLREAVDIQLFARRAFHYGERELVVIDDPTPIYELEVSI